MTPNLEETGRITIRRKVAEERALAVFAQALNTMHLGVTITDTVGRVIFANAAVARMHGYAPDEILGCDVKVLSPPGEEKPAARLGISRTREGIGVRRDGSTFPISLTSDLIEGTGGKPIGLVTTWEDITERKRTEKTLLHSSLHDLLTGLPNRAFLLERIDAALARVRRRPQEVAALLFLDVDRFKMINDSAGHLVGDQLLVEIASRLSSCFREGDTLARFGGDEFTMLLEGISSPEEARRAAERVVEAMEPPFSLAGQSVSVSVSIGIAMLSSRYERAQDLLRDADTAMYRAKEQGRGGWQVFDLEMHESAVSRLRVECDLRRALERGELALHYQPIVSLASGALAGVEALVRWRHPARGLLFPDAFVPIAEESGLVVPLDRWVLRTACGHLATWRRRHPEARALSLAVNLSARQFHAAGLADTVTEVLAESGIEASALHLEITETAVMKDPGQASAIVGRLREIGVRVHLDDFGTGYSSFGHLLRLSVDALKIDRVFTASLDTRREGFEIMRAIVTLGRNLGIPVITEGIENDTQLALLRELGCPLGQGYRFSAALEPDELDELLANGEAVFPRPPGSRPPAFDVERTLRTPVTLQELLGSCDVRGAEL